METASEVPLHQESSRKGHKKVRTLPNSTILLRQPDLPPLPKNWAMTPPGAISRNIKRLREEAGMSQAALAEASSVHNVGVWERKREIPANHPLLPKVAAALARKLRRPVVSVLDELKLGGTEYDIPPYIEHLMRNQKRSKRRSKRADRWTRRSKRAASTKASAQLAPVIDKPLKQSAKAIAQRARHKQPTQKLRGKDLQKLLNDPILLARTLVTTFNHQRESGELSITLPLIHFQPMLEQYLDSLHLPTNILLPDFEEIF